MITILTSIFLASYTPTVPVIPMVIFPIITGSSRTTGEVKDDSGLSRSRKKYLKCKKTQEEGVFVCRMPTAEQRRSDGEPVAFRCHTTSLSHVTLTTCSNGGKPIYHERGSSGPHPRDKNKL